MHDLVTFLLTMVSSCLPILLSLQMWMSVLLCRYSAMIAMFICVTDQNSGWVWRLIRIALNSCLVVWPTDVIRCQSLCGVRILVLYIVNVSMPVCHFVWRSPNYIVKILSSVLLNVSLSLSVLLRQHGVIETLSSVLQDRHLQVIKEVPTQVLFATVHDASSSVTRWNSTYLLLIMLAVLDWFIHSVHSGFA